jgi:peroxiredoxin
VVFGFVDMAKQAEIRRSCEPLVQLRPRYMGADRAAPDFELPDEMGRPVRLSSFRGKVVILHFWTKTCGPCLDELPDVAKFAERIRSRSDVVILTVTIDDGPTAVADVWATLFGGKLPPFIVAYDREGKVVQPLYGTTKFPETWLIDPQGVIRARFDGIPMGGENCEVAWRGTLLMSAVDAVKGPAVCPLTFDPKYDPKMDHLVAPCRQ